MSNTTKARVDRPHQIQYPGLPDRRGSTRVIVGRKHYYFGPHESASSHVMFGLWKGQYEKTGEPPETRDIRPLAAEVLKREVVTPPETKSLFATPLLVFASVALTLLTVFAVGKFSSENEASVDGVALSADEKDFIRGTRNHESRMQQLKEDKAKHLAHMLAQYRQGVSIDELKNAAKRGF